MVADPVLLIERLAANAWPAATVQIADGWLLRHTPAVARRRSNSALPPPSAAAAGPARRAQALEVAERFYARRNQAALVQVSSAELHGRLDHELAARGYDRQAPTVVSTAPIDRLLAVRPPAPTLAVSVGLTASPRWLTAWTEMEDRPDAEATGQLVLARIAPRTGFLTATHDDQVLGVGMLVVERGWAGVFCMATRPDTAAAASPPPCSRPAPAGRPARGPATSTSRSSSTTSRPSASTTGSASIRPTTTTTAWPR